MIPFSTLLLREYYRAIGWNEDNTYSQLTRSSSAILDFTVPPSLVLQLANSPTPVFFTSYALDALPQLNGSVSYITTSAEITNVGPSRSIPFHHVVDRFRIFPPPHRPLPKDEIWQNGRRIEGRDYLLYSRLHLPSLHLSGLLTTRLTPTLQAHAAFLSPPSPPSRSSHSSSSSSHSRQSSSDSSPAQVQAPGNLLLSLQHDTGRWAGEYTYSAQDGMFGMRGLWNFGWRAQAQDPADDVEEEGDVVENMDRSRTRARAVDEEEKMEGGLRGRLSAGGEVYFSARQRSFGISTGLRFTTLPPVFRSSPISSSSSSSSVSPPIPPPSAPYPPSNPPTTLTLLYNPLIGFLSSAYTAQVSPTLSLSSRFGVNVYSYESDLSVGGEWWIGRRRGKRDASTPDMVDRQESAGTGGARDVVAAYTGSTDQSPDIGGLSLRDRDGPLPPVSDSTSTPTQANSVGHGRAISSALAPNDGQTREYERDGVLKARLSGDWSLALLYEARIRNCLVSMGVVSDLMNRQRPINSIGLEVQYFS